MRHLLRGACMALFFMASAFGQQTLPNAWRAAGLQDDLVLRSARFALLEKARQSRVAFTLLAIKHARQQEAQGMHHSMNLMVQTEGKRRLVIAVVWTKPNGSMELTRWHWV